MVRGSHQDYGTSSVCFRFFRLNKHLQSTIPQEEKQPASNFVKKQTLSLHDAIPGCLEKLQDLQRVKVTFFFVV
jgi:hypothetical protein